MSAVFFDLDGTLLTGLSSERRLVRRLRREGCLGLRQKAAAALFIAIHVARYGRHVLKKNKAYLSGLDRETLETLARQLLRDELAGAWYPPCRARLRGHLEAGDTVALMTGSPSFLAEPVAAALGIKHVIASRCPQRGGRFRAALPLRHPFGRAKRDLAEAFCREQGLDLVAATAYADSGEDLPLLEAVGTPVAVRPDTRLARVARVRGWEIIA